MIYSCGKRRPKGKLQYAVWVDGNRVTNWTTDKALAERTAVKLNGVVKVQVGW